MVVGVVASKCEFTKSLSIASNLRNTISIKLMKKVGIRRCNADDGEERKKWKVQVAPSINMKDM